MMHLQQLKVFEQLFTFLECAYLFKCTALVVGISLVLPFTNGLLWYALIILSCYYVALAASAIINTDTPNGGVENWDRYLVYLIPFSVLVYALKKLLSN